MSLPFFRHYLVFFFIGAALFWPGRPSAQEFVFENISSRILLPANETYHVLQDRQGYVWIATEEGLCKVWRNNLEVFDKRNGLPEKAVYALTIGPDGKVWVETKHHRILYYDGTVFREAFFSKKYVATITYISYPQKLIFENEFLYIANDSRITRVNTKTGEMTTLPRKPRSGGIFTVSGEVTFLGKTIPGDYDGYYVEEWDLLFRPARGIPHAPVQIMKLDGKILVGDNKFLYAVDKTGKSKRHLLPDRILCVAADAQGNIYAGCQNHGLYFFKNGDLTASPTVSLANYSVSGILPDRDGGLWCTTLENGVYYCQNTSVRSYQSFPELTGRIGIIQQLDDLGLIVAKNGIKNGVLFRKNGGTERVRMPVASSLYYFTKASHGYYLSTNPFSYKVDQGLKRFTQYKTNWYPGFAYYIIEENRKQALVFPNHISLADSQGQLDMLFSFVDGKYRGSLQLDDSTYLIYGTNLFLYFNTFTNKVTRINLPIKEVNVALLLRGSQKIFVSTKDDGFFEVDRKTNKFVSISSPLPTEVVHTVCKDAKGNLWFGTNIGIFRTDNRFGRVVWANKKLNLPISECRFLVPFFGRLFAATNEGVFSFPADLGFNKAPTAAPVLGSAEIHEKRVEIRVHINYFGHDAEAVYWLKGENASIHKTALSSDKIVFNALSAGNYELFCRIETLDGRQSAIVSRKFTVVPAFTETIWFILLVVLVVLLTGLVIFRWQVRRIRRREEQKTALHTQLAEFQMSALQAQMNPHFIFNAINTIQSYILTKNKDEAYRYLNKFSNLIRLVLYHSQEKLITLHEELEVINTYLELEHARFSSFEYEIQVSEEIDIHEVQVPPMVIQPYLENAIWHGLNNLTTRKGKLLLSFSLEENYLLIVVEDNGIGREEAAKHRKTRHKSMGLSLTEKRLEMLKTLFEEGDAIVEVFDKTESGTPSGTVVFVRIPLL